MTNSMFLVLVLLLLSYLCSTQAPPYPKWGSVYSQSFMIVDIDKNTTTGKIWYDYNLNAQR